MPATKTRKQTDVEPTPVVNPEHAVQADEHDIVDGADANIDLGEYTAKEMYPAGANPVGVPDWLPIYPTEKVTESYTSGDVTWWHTNEGRWLTSKGVLPQATQVTHGPFDEPPTPDEVREQNEDLRKVQAKHVERGEKMLQDEQVELNEELNEERREFNKTPDMKANEQRREYIAEKAAEDMERTINQSGEIAKAEAKAAREGASPTKVADEGQRAATKGATPESRTARAKATRKRASSTKADAKPSEPAPATEARAEPATATAGAGEGA